MKRNFTFKDEEFMTAVEKARVLRAWERFLKSGLARTQFTKALYKHLTLHCGFIAHYNLHGFYSVYFEEGHTKARFLSQFDKRGPMRSVEYGYTPFYGNYGFRDEYKDIALAMVEVGADYIPALIESALAEQKNSDIATAKALLEKHGLGGSL